MSESSPSREALIARIGETVMRWQEATQRFDEAVGRLYGLNAAERHCLSLLWRGPLPPGVIAREIGLTPPSVTALVDRLEKRGFVTRRPDPDDRRKLQIAITDQTVRMTEKAYIPTAQAGERRLRTYSDEELEAVVKFTADAVAVQEEALDRLLAGDPRAP